MLNKKFGAYGIFPVIIIAVLAFWPRMVSAQNWAVRTNVLYDAMLIPSLGAEYALSDRHSISLNCTYTPFSVGDKKWKNWSVQPEFRIWKEAPYFGFFLGMNVIGGGFNIDNVKIGGLGGEHRQGYFMGTGLSLGYHKILSSHWNLELSVGADVLLTSYEKINNGQSDGFHQNVTILPIGTGISIVYVFE